MIVCQCNKITDTQILACVDEGITNYYEIQRLIGCGTTCGSCMPNVVDCIYSRRVARNGA